MTVYAFGVDALDPKAEGTLVPLQFLGRNPASSHAGQSGVAPLRCPAGD
jgi:hypothetical protein